MSSSKEEIVLNAIARQLQQNKYYHMVDSFNHLIDVSYQLVVTKFDEDVCNFHLKPCNLMDTDDVINLL